MAVLPVVRYLILCDDVQIDPTNPHRVDLIGVASAVVSRSDPPFPCRFDRLSVFVQLTECRGPGRGQAVLLDAETDEPVIGSVEHLLDLKDDPLLVQTVVFRMDKIRFKHSGLYWVRFKFDGVPLHQVPLIVR